MKRAHTRSFRLAAAFSCTLLSAVALVSCAGRSQRVTPLTAPQTLGLALPDGHVLGAELHLLREVPGDRGEYRHDEVTAKLEIRVLGHARSGLTWIEVRPLSVKSAWTPSPDSPVGATEFAKQADEELQRTKWRFSIDENGHFVDFPIFSESLSPDIRLLSDFIIQGLTMAWVHNERKPLAPGQPSLRRSDWQREDSRDSMREERSELVGQYPNGDVSFRQQVLERHRVVERSRGYEERQRIERVGRYAPASGRWHESQGSRVAETDADETVRFELRLATLTEGKNTGKYFEVQRNISDPCGADYVGPLSCRAADADVAQRKLLPQKVVEADDVAEDATTTEDASASSTGGETTATETTAPQSPTPPTSR